MTNAPNQRYEVIEKIDAGGMAEVFRGRAISIEGFEKQVAIKRVLPHLAKNQKFVNMFLDEARLSLFLDHANVVSVFDLGRAADTYFIVMEYVDGLNLKKILEWSRDERQPIPVELAAYITIEICKGLDYAHNKRDGAGAPLRIVHRDVSPPNVLLSRQGEVKVTDFGLAKAQSQIEVTDPGVVKGKFGYLSPEGASGEAIDHRTDIFAVGIVLWELLAGRRLFQGKTDIDTLQLVRKAEVPSLAAINPSVPSELDEIVRAALTRDPEQRIQAVRDFGMRLSRFLFRQGVSVTSYDLAALVSGALDGVSSVEDSGQRRVMSTVIQDEINRLIRIEGAANETGPAVASTALEDPRTWLDFGFDEPEAPAPGARSTMYASRGVAAVAGETATRVRSGVTAKSAAVPETPVPVLDTPAPFARSAGSAVAPRVSETEQHEIADEQRARSIFYALLGVVGLAAGYVVYLLLSAS